MRSPAVQAFPVVTYQDRAAASFAYGQVDRACRPRHQRDERRLVTLADDAQDAMSPLEGHVFDVGAAGFADPEPVQPQ